MASVMADMEPSTMAELLANPRPQWLKFLTKPIATYNNTLIDYNEVRKHVQLTDSRTWTGSNPGATFAGVGAFHILPFEIIYDIFSRTTVQSLMHFRASNSTLKALVESWPPFRDAMTKAQPAVGALIATRASKLWTFTDLRPEIYTKTCYLCGEHGEIIHLLKLKRVCFKCVTTDRRLLAIPKTYACQEMGLCDSDIETLPHSLVIPQRSIWGRSETAFGYAIDWIPAVNLAIFAQKSRAVNRGPDGKIRHISTLLITPPESENVQHGCCIYLPVLDLSKKDSIPRHVRALLCAGCSFYFNYHSPLPHQTHTLYPYNPTPTEHSWTPLLAHLKFCHYAYVYFRTHVFPAELLPHPNHPLLLADNGRFTPQYFRDLLQEHHYQIFFADSPYRHFRRHRVDTSPAGRYRGVTVSQNNAHFEMIPIPLLHLMAKARKIPHQTGLELELTQKLQNADPDIAAMLQPSEDHRFDIWTRNRLISLRRQQEKRDRMATFHHPPTNTASTSPSTNFTLDTYGDLLLASTSTISQTQWATAHTSSAGYLFGKWTSLFHERREKQEAYEARQSGRRMTDPRKRTVEWGFDRFGCVSDLG